MSSSTNVRAVLARFAWFAVMVPLFVAAMKLEDQENSKQRIEKAIQERAAIIKNEMPKNLWD